MRLTLTNDDCEVLAAWDLPNTLLTAQVELILTDGLWHKHRLDRCDECGGFVPHQDMVERHEPHGPEAVCPACAGDVKEA